MNIIKVPHSNGSEDLIDLNSVYRVGSLSEKGNFSNQHYMIYFTGNSPLQIFTERPRNGVEGLFMNRDNFIFKWSGDIRFYHT